MCIIHLTIFFPVTLFLRNIKNISEVLAYSQPIQYGKGLDKYDILSIFINVS